MEAQISKELNDSLIKIAKKSELQLLVLFGSRAKLKANTNSDYDLAYVCNNSSQNKILNLIEDLSSLFKEKSFDLVDLNSQKNSILLNHNISRYGVVIFEEKKGMFREFKEKSYFDFIDAKDWLERMQDNYLKS